MLSEQKVCKWITAKTQEGRGAVVFCLEENNGFVGVWVGEPSEHEKALGYGDDVVEAVLDAISKEAVEHRVQRTAFGPSWNVRLANLIIRLGWWVAEIGSR